MPSARASVPFSEMSCRTVFKRSDPVRWVMLAISIGCVCDTPTRNPSGPPSTSFSRAARPRPSGVRQRSARYASPRRGEDGGKEDNLQKDFYTGQGRSQQQQANVITSEGRWCLLECPLGRRLWRRWLRPGCRTIARLLPHLGANGLIFRSIGAQLGETLCGCWQAPR